MEEKHLFKSSRWKLTLSYTVIAGIMFLLLLLLSNIFAWWTLFHYKEKEMVELSQEEAREYIQYSDFPVGESEIRNGTELAYIKNMNGIPVLDLMGTAPEGLALLARQGLWPQDNDEVKVLHIQHNSRDFYFMACRVLVQEKGEEPYGHLYIFENVYNYYLAAVRITYILIGVFLLFLGIALRLGYYLAGKSLEPLKAAYEKEQQFTADASHEMRTPLAVLRLAAGSILEDDENVLSEMSKESLGMIQQEVGRMTHLTQSLMGLVREDNFLSNSFHTYGLVNMSFLTGQTVKELQLVASEQGKEIKCSVMKNLEIWGDEESLKRLLIILMDNALKYSEAGSIVTINLLREKKNIILQVADQGEGISDADKEKIFQRFYRVDKARSRRQGGIGLGLCLASSIAQRHGGKIKVRDNEPQGSIFEVVFK